MTRTKEKTRLFLAVFFFIFDFEDNLMALHVDKGAEMATRYGREDLVTRGTEAKQMEENTDQGLHF